MSETDSPILWVEDLDDSHRPLVGSKMSRLGQLARWGLTVPAGFGIAAAAYHRFMEASGLNDLVDELVGNITDIEDTEAVDVAAARIRGEVESAPMEDELRDALVAAYEQLCHQLFYVDVPVAVRSSAIGEDAADASFAGQFDTYLGLSGSDVVVDGVRRCWASLFTDRGIIYRRKNELTHRTSPMAVCVLELIDARSSGVAFSLDPVSGKRDRIVIEGNWGWGETVVQGLVTPDRAVVDKEDLRVLSHDVRDKQTVSTFDASEGRVVERDMPEPMATAPVLSDEQLAAIAVAVKQIEDNYGQPMDVEWVIPRSYRSGDPATIVQTRPETVYGETAEEPVEWDPVAMATKYAFGGD